MPFREKYPTGRLGEGHIARWLNRRGTHVLPIYEIEVDSGKGPRLFTADGQFIALDLFAFHKDRGASWMEAKTKTVFTWYRKKQKWQTGIDLRHYEDYLRVADLSPWPVWLLFLHTEDRNDERPEEPWPCPTGLFGNTLDFLREHEDHRGMEWAHGMVYWNHEDLKLLASLHEVYTERPRLLD